MSRDAARNDAAALAEARRCLLCDDPPCHGGCPAGVNPRDFIRKIRFGDIHGAARLLRRNNPLYGVCGDICPADNTCMGRCTSEKLDRPIDIIGLQRHVADWERRVFARKPNPIRPVAPDLHDPPVAVIGAGPAGLAAAAELALRGRRVVLFDRAARPGGMLRRTLPTFRLADDRIEHDVRRILDLGVRFRGATTVPDARGLFAEGYAGVILAAGAHRAKPLGVPGETLPGVVSGLDLLERVRRGDTPALGPRVVVVGGGDVAIDAARAAVRLGARVTLAYRRGRTDMPAYGPEVAGALDEGIEFLFNTVPERILGEKNATGVRLLRVRWDAAGRQARTFQVLGAPLDVEADTVVAAVGLEPDGAAAAGLPADGASPRVTDRLTGATEVPGIHVAGDLAHGPATAVAAVGSGRCAAAALDAWIEAGDAPTLLSDVVAAPSEPAWRVHCTTCSLPEGRPFYEPPKADLAVEMCGVRFVNPFVLAAAPPSDDLEMVRSAFRAGWAGAVLKTTSVEGTPVPLAYPMMSGLEIDGRRLAGMGNIDLISEHHIDAIERRVRALKEEFPDRIVIGSIMGATKEDWQSLVRRLQDAGADLIECSFSCPQGTLGGRPGAMLGQDPEASRTVASWVKEAATRIPVLIKITPQVADVAETAAAVREAGVDGITASNTIPSLMGIDLDTWVPNPNVGGRSTFSGMSGPAIKPITLRTIAEIARRTGAPISGTGGPVTWSDAAELMLVGARTVQFCTAVMHHGCGIVEDLREGLGDYLDRRGLARAGDLCGRALPHIAGHEELPRGIRVRSRIDLDRCIRCGDCVVACRDGGHRAIDRLEDRTPKVDDDRCVGCALCSLLCPVPGCISMRAVGSP
jgi:dihydropyrimidine dehydrogenase (NAD+) subunit PreA